METKLGFALMDVSELAGYLSDLSVARTIKFIQQHHTYIPAYQHFNGDHFATQQGMKTHHVQNNGWSDIGQHFTIFPDGKIATGRNLERTPACIYGNNSHSICIENLGDFDVGKDQMTLPQKEAIVAVTAILCETFNVPVSTQNIVYHHWFDLQTGARTNGNSGVSKTCPGTAFFGGNKVADCENEFIPLVKEALAILPDGTNPSGLIAYGVVTANNLNIYAGKGSKNKKLGSTTLGSVVRIYAKEGRWYKIARSKEEWVYINYVDEVQRGIVNANVLNVRSGPSIEFQKLGAVLKGQEIFVYEEKVDWLRISAGEQWVSSHYIDLN